MIQNNQNHYKSEVWSICWSHWCRFRSTTGIRLL